MFKENLDECRGSATRQFVNYLHSVQIILHFSVLRGCEEWQFC